MSLAQAFSNLGPFGTVTANATTPVAEAVPSISADSVVILSLKTVGGSAPGQAFVSSLTAGTGFSITSLANDTSVYNYYVMQPF